MAAVTKLYTSIVHFWKGISTSLQQQKTKMKNIALEKSY
jgi:hypothetical protein